MKKQIEAHEIKKGDFIYLGKTIKEVLEVNKYKTKESKLVIGSDDIGRFIINKHYTHKVGILIEDKRTSDKLRYKCFNKKEKLFIKK